MLVFLLLLLMLLFALVVVTVIVVIVWPVSGLFLSVHDTLFIFSPFFLCYFHTLGQQCAQGLCKNRKIKKF